MKMRQSAVAVALAVLSGYALADDVDGTWIANVDSPMGAIEVQFILAANGPALTGTVAAGGMQVGSITEGKIDGNDVAFKLPVMGFDGGPGFTIAYEGTVNGDELKLVSTFEGGPTGDPMVTEITAKRLN